MLPNPKNPDYKHLETLDQESWSKVKRFKHEAQTNIIIRYQTYYLPALDLIRRQQALLVSPVVVTQDDTSSSAAASGSGSCCSAETLSGVFVNHMYM